MRAAPFLPLALTAALALPVAASAAIVVTPLGSTTAAAGSTTLTLTTTAACPNGGDIVVVAGTNTNLASAGAVDSGGVNAYAGNSAIVNTGRFRLYHSSGGVALASGQTITVNWSANTGIKFVSAVCLTKVGPLDQEVNGTTGSSTAPTITSATLGNVNEVVIGAVEIASGSADTYTQASGFTTLGDMLNSSAVRWGYKIVSSNAAVTYAPTLGTSRAWGTMMETYAGTSCGALNLLGAGC